MTKEGLPSAFLEEMRQLLGEEYPAYEKAWKNRGIPASGSIPQS